ncbi:unnamed protein product, partial [Cladocopium goreaui]
ALAPYAADPTVVLRTDWFSGSGWLATHEAMQEMLSQWHLGSPWDAMFRDERLRRKRQFLTPEVSRDELGSANDVESRQFPWNDLQYKQRVFNDDLCLLEECPIEVLLSIAGEKNLAAPRSEQLLVRMFLILVVQDPDF